MNPRRPALLGLCLAVLVAACGVDPTADRRAWLRNTLIADNQTILEREPDLVAGKFAKMQRGVYPFFRGTASQFLRDLTRPDRLTSRSRFGTPASARVLILGDPHPENIGAYRNADGEIVVDFNDFDGAQYGPYTFDLRRLAFGFYVAGVGFGVPTVDASTRVEAAQAVSAGYAAEMQQLLAGDGGVHVRGDSGFGPIIDRLAHKAEEDGAALEKLEDYTRVDGGKRVMFYGELETPDGIVISDRVDPVPDRVVDMLRAQLPRYRATLESPVAPDTLSLKGVSRRFGAGVSSYPLLRYYVLVEGPTALPDDDWLLEVKETTSPRFLEGLPRYPAAPWRSNGERAIATQRESQEGREDDPLLGWIDPLPLSMRISHRTAYQRDLGVNKIAERLLTGEYVPQDYVDLAYTAGRLLARSHGNARTLDGRMGRDVIAEAVDGDWAGLAAETTDFATGYAQQLDEDFKLFDQLLETDGPLLGYTPR